MRLIDEDALREVLETAAQITPITQQYNKEDVIRAIMDAPTIANGTDSIMIKWTPDLDKLAQDVAFRGLNEFSFLGKSIREWVEIILEQPEWISVKDRMPDIDGEYMVYGQSDAMWELLPDSNPIWICYYCKKHGFYNIELHREYDYITHWMPLPKPPKEVSGDE